MKVNRWLFLLIIISGCSKNNSLLIDFDAELFLESQINFIKELENINLNSIQKIKEVLVKQDWIEGFYLKKERLGNTRLFINTRNPLLNWENTYFIDKNLNMFSSTGKFIDLPTISAPFDKLSEWVVWHELFLDASLKNEHFLEEIRYVYGAGWEVTTNLSVIKMGNIINEDIYQKYQEALIYIFRMKLNPSIIDLRNMNGITLSYAKK